MKKRAFLIITLSTVLVTVFCMHAFGQEMLVLEEIFTDQTEIDEGIDVVEAEEMDLLPEMERLAVEEEICQVPITEETIEEEFEEISLLPAEEPVETGFEEILLLPAEEPEEIRIQEIQIQEIPIIVIEETLITEEEQQEEPVLGDIAEGSVLLLSGMTGDEVRALQQLLIRKGYLSGVADGIFGPVTEAAVKKYQFYNGKDITGATDTSAFGDLYRAAGKYQDLMMGSEGEAVIRLQKVLKTLGFDPGEIDGQFGPATYQAVVDFQDAYDLYADGIVGNKTLSAIVDLPGITVSIGSTYPASDYSAELKKGMTGNEILLLQQTLARKGYLTSAIDGDFGKMTEIAVRNYQLYNGLEVTGIVDSTMLRYLAGSKTYAFADLTVGSEGAAVISLQKALKKLGFDPGSIDGQFGQKTYQAVVAFQNANKLVSDGIVGLKTISAIAGSPAVISTEQDTADQEPSVVVDKYAIKAGSVGENVIKMQKALAAYGYLDSEVDGYFGPMTELSLKKFQVYNDLPVSSTASSDVLKLLYSYNAVPYSTLKVGSTGTAVKGIQRVLYNLGYLDVLPDGIYGNVTSHAVGLFQYVNDLDHINGTADHDTIDELTDLQDGYEREMTSITPEQRKLIQTAYTVPTTAAGMCASWVSNVLAAYGISSSEILSTRESEYSYAYDNDLTDANYAYDTDFNANDYWAYICDSDDKADLKPGMIIATRNTYSYLGKQFGHVGFYLGNNKVISSIGYIETVDLDIFDEQYNNKEYGSTMRWGFAPSLLD